MDNDDYDNNDLNDQQNNSDDVQTSDNDTNNNLNQNSDEDRPNIIINSNPDSDRQLNDTPAHYVPTLSNEPSKPYTDFTTSSSDFYPLEDTNEATDSDIYNLESSSDNNLKDKQTEEQQQPNEDGQEVNEETNEVNNEGEVNDEEEQVEVQPNEEGEDVNEQETDNINEEEVNNEEITNEEGEENNEEENEVVNEETNEVKETEEVNDEGENNENNEKEVNNEEEKQQPNEEDNGNQNTEQQEDDNLYNLEDEEEKEEQSNTFESNTFEKSNRINEEAVEEHPNEEATEEKEERDNNLYNLEDEEGNDEKTNVFDSNTFEESNQINDDEEEKEQKEEPQEEDKAEEVEMEEEKNVKESEEEFQEEKENEFVEEIKEQQQNKNEEKEEDINQTTEKQSNEIEKEEIEIENEKEKEEVELSINKPQSSSSSVSEPLSDRQQPTDDRSVVSDTSSYVNNYIDRMVDGIVEDETLEEVDSEYENSDSENENNEEINQNENENKENDDIEPLTSIRTDTTQNKSVKKNKKKKAKKVKPPFNNRVDPKNKRVIPEYKYYDLEHMTPVGYKLAMKNLKDYEKAKKKDEEEKIDHYMKLKSKEIYAKKKYATKVTRKYKPPHKYTLREIIHMGYPSEPPTPTTTDTSEMGDEGYTYMKQDLEGGENEEENEEEEKKATQQNQQNKQQKSVDNNDINNLGYNSDEGEEDNDNIVPLPNENDYNNDTHYESNEIQSYKLSNNPSKSGGPVLNDEERTNENKNMKRPPTSKRITEMTFDNCETPNTEASTPCSTGRMLTSSRSERRALKKEKKRQRRLFRGVMNSACFFFSLYAKVKERRLMNPKMQSRLKNAKDNEYQHALKIVTITASKKYGADPPSRNKKLDKILNRNRISKDKDLDYYIKYMKEDIKEDHTREEIRSELRKRIEKIKNEHTEKVKWDTEFETIYQRFLIQHKVMLKNITPFHLMEKFTDCFEFKLALEKGTKSKRKIEKPSDKMLDIIMGTYHDEYKEKIIAIQRYWKLYLLLKDNYRVFVSKLIAKEKEKAERKTLKPTYMELMCKDIYEEEVKRVKDEEVEHWMEARNNWLQGIADYSKKSKEELDEKLKLPPLYTFDIDKIVNDVKESMKSEDQNLPTLKERRRRMRGRNNHDEVESKVRSSQSAPMLKNIHPLPPPLNPPQPEKPRGLSITSSERYLTPNKTNNDSVIHKISERAKTPLPPPLEMPSCSTYDSSSGTSSNNINNSNKTMKLTDKLEHYYENKEHVDDVLSIYIYIYIFICFYYFVVRTPFVEKIDMLLESDGKEETSVVDEKVLEKLVDKSYLRMRKNEKVKMIRKDVVESTAKNYKEKFINKKKPKYGIWDNQYKAECAVTTERLVQMNPEVEKKPKKKAVEIALERIANMFEAQYIESLKQFKPIKRDQATRILGSINKKSRVSQIKNNNSKGSTPRTPKTLSSSRSATSITTPH